MYTVPLTLKTYVPAAWKQVLVKQGTKVQRVKPSGDGQGTYVLYQANPNSSAIQLSGV
jgi:hypothetical protein